MGGLAAIIAANKTGRREAGAAASMVTAERLWALVATPRADEGRACREAREALVAALDGVEVGLATSLEPQMASVRQALAGRLGSACNSCGLRVNVRKKRRAAEEEAEEQQKKKKQKSEEEEEEER